MIFGRDCNIYFRQEFENGSDNLTLDNVENEDNPNDTKKENLLRRQPLQQCMPLQ